MSKFKFLVKNSSWFVGANVAGSFLSVILLPLYTSYLSPADYGIIAIVLLAADVISCFSSFGLEYFNQRVLYRFKTKKEQLGVLLGNVYFVAFILILSTSVILSVFPNLIHHLFFNDSKIPTAIILFIPIWHAFLSRIPRFLMDYLTIDQEGQKYFIINSSRVFTVHSFKIIALVLLRTGVVGFLMAELITQLILSIITVVMLKRYVKPRINLKKMRIVKVGIFYGIPYIPQNIGAWIMKSVDRIILLKFVDMWDVGIYSLAVNISAQVTQLLWTGIGRGVFPEVVARMDNRQKYANSELHTIEHLYSYLIIGSFGGLLFSLFAKEIVYILANERYHEAHKVIPLIILVYVFQQLHRIFSFPIELKLKTWFFPANTFLGAVLSTILNLILIPIFGVFGAALANVLMRFAIMITALVYAQRQIYIGYNYFIALLPILVSILLFLPKALFEYSLIWSICESLLLTIFALFFSVLYIKKYCPTIWEVIGNVYNRFLLNINVSILPRKSRH